MFPDYIVGNGSKVLQNRVLQPKLEQEAEAKELPDFSEAGANFYTLTALKPERC